VGCWQKWDAPVKVYDEMQPKTGVRQLPLPSFDRNVANMPIIPDFSFDTGSQVVPEGSIMHVPHDEFFVIVLMGGNVQDDLDRMAFKLALLVSFFSIDDAVAIGHYAAWSIELRLDLSRSVVLPALRADSVLYDPLISLDADSPFCTG